MNKRFSTWHVKLSPEDKQAIGKSFKSKLRPMAELSRSMMNEMGVLDYEVTPEHVDLIVEMGSTGFEMVIDTTTHLDHFVKWAVANYSPPAAK